MFFRFAKGDSEAGILRPKVLLIFLRYIIGVIVLIWNIKALLIVLMVYVIWSVLKNFKYIFDFRAVFVLPALQIISDLAVLSGTVRGTYKKYGI